MELSPDWKKQAAYSHQWEAGQMPCCLPAFNTFLDISKAASSFFLEGAGTEIEDLSICLPLYLVP